MSNSNLKNITCFLFTFQANEFLYSGRIMNAVDAQKIGLVNEIINDGVVGRNNLINKIRTEMAVYTSVKHNLLPF